MDLSIARRVARKLEWLAENAENLEPTGLRRGLAGLLDCEKATIDSYEIRHLKNRHHPRRWTPQYRYKK